MGASAIEFQVDSRAISALVALGDGALVAEVQKAIERAEVELLITHFDKLEAERSGKTGGTPTHFWRQVRDSVHGLGVTDVTVSIGIGQVGFRQRLEGGTIHAGQGISSATGEKTKYLAIAVDVDSYGKRPSDFPQGALQYIVGPAGPCLILVEHTDRIATKGRPKGKAIKARGGLEATHGAGSVMFILRESVMQKRDPSVLPTDAQIIAAALAAGSKQAQVLPDRITDGVANGNN